MTNAPKDQARKFWIAAASGALALSLGAVFATRGAWSDIAHIALRDDEASHILLVPAVFAWMVYDRRRALSAIVPSPTVVGPILVALGWLLCHRGFNHATQSLWHGGAVLVVIGAATTLLGTAVLRAVLPAVVVLVLLIPIPGTIRQAVALPMQNAAAATTAAILQFGGAAVHREGNLLLVNGRPVAIVEACNGLRMIFGLLLVCYTLAFSMKFSTAARMTILAASPAIALLCNVIRLVPTVALYGYGSTSLADRFHSAAGWAMLPAAALLTLALARMAAGLHRQTVHA